MRSFYHAATGMAPRSGVPKGLTWIWAVYTLTRRCQRVAGMVMWRPAISKVALGCYLHGKMRRTDFLPVGEAHPDEVLERGIDSEPSDEDDGCGLENAFDEEDECCSEAGDPDGSSGHCLVDFI